MISTIAVIAAFLWIGFVCAISFMEAWLKFRAPGVTLSLGLGIGRLVFSALNKIELIMALTIIASLVVAKNTLFISQNLLFFIPLLLLLTQTLWLLPALDRRAINSIKGAAPGKSTLHFYYVGMEIAKVICLFIFGINLFNV